MSTQPSQFDIRTAYADRALPTEPQLCTDIDHVLTHGFVVLDACFSSTQAKEARDEISRLLGDQPLTGRNAFEGHATNRIYSLLNKSRVFDKFAILPRVLALNDFFLDPGYLLSAFHTITINPGEQPQRLHHDDEYIRSFPRPRTPFGTAIMVALSPYTAINGATRIIPGSHTWGEASTHMPSELETIPATMPEGSVLYFISTLWHGGGKNESSEPRQSLTVQYCQPFIRPIENQVLAVDPRRLEAMDQKIVDMMGYRVMQPFMGYADGMNPLRAARRMVLWLGCVLEEKVPTFAHEAREGEERVGRESKL